MQLHLHCLLVGLPNETHEGRRREGRRGTWFGFGLGFVLGFGLGFVLGFGFGSG